MEFFLGLLAGAVFFVVNGACLYVGYRLGSKQKPAPVKKPEQETELDRAKKKFQKIMSYSTATATKRKKVTDVD